MAKEGDLFGSGILWNYCNPSAPWKDKALRLKLTIYFTCNISKVSDKVDVLKRCELIVWDECTMVHKGALSDI